MKQAQAKLQNCISPPGVPEILITRPGDAGKANPFTIVLIANPVLETPTGTGVFAAGPIMTDRAAFDASRDYIVQCLL